MKKLLFTILAIAAFSVSSQAFTRFLPCTYLQGYVSQNVYNIPTTFRITLYAKHSSQPGENVYARYIAYSRQGANLQYNMAIASMPNQVFRCDHEYSPILAEMYYMNLSCNAQNRGDFAYVYLRW